VSKLHLEVSANLWCLVDFVKNACIDHYIQNDFQNVSICKLYSDLYG